MRRTDPLIVGGGPAGAATAIRLAQGSARPYLIERHPTPQGGVCGAFLGWDALAALGSLGIDPWALGAQPIARVRLITGHTIVERPLPRTAAGLSRHALDTALLNRAAQAGATIERGIAARRLDADGLHLADGRVLDASSLFLATGKHGLRGLPRDAATRNAHVGLRTAIPAPPDLAGAIELHLFRGGYAGLLMQEDGQANLCLSVKADRLAAAGGSPEALIARLATEAPMLAQHVAATIGEWAAVAGVPYGWRAASTAPGQFRVGDQAAVIASLVGDGIALALASGNDAAAAWLKGGSAAAPAFQRGFARRAARPIKIAEGLRRSADHPWLAQPMVRLLGIIPGGVALAAHLTRIGH